MRRKETFVLGPQLRQLGRRHDQQLHGVTGPRADIVREVIELLLPSLVLRDVVVHHHEEVDVACGIDRRPRGAAEDRGVDRLKLPSSDTLAQARGKWTVQLDDLVSNCLNSARTR